MMLQTRVRATGATVWTGKDISLSQEWIFRFPQAALDEIDDSIARLRQRGASVDGVGRDDFPLYSMRHEIEGLRHEIADGRGFAVLRGIPRERYSDAELGFILWGLGTHFGTGMPQSHLGDRLGSIMDLSDEEPDPRRRRAYHSGGAQFVHTDSCDIVAMISLRTAKAGGASRLASSHTVHNLMLDFCPKLLDVLYEGFRLQEPDSDAAAAGRAPLSAHKIPAFMTTDGWLNCFFLKGGIDRAVERSGVRLTPEERAAAEVFVAFANHPDVYLDMMLNPGDMQFVNNRKVLHGRAAFEDHLERERRRHLYRIWLTVPEWPQMAEVQSAYSSDAVKLKWEADARARRAAAGS